MHWTYNQYNTLFNGSVGYLIYKNVVLQNGLEVLIIKWQNQQVKNKTKVVLINTRSAKKKVISVKAL